MLTAKQAKYNSVNSRLNSLTEEELAQLKSVEKQINDKSVSGDAEDEILYFDTLSKRTIAVLRDKNYTVTLEGYIESYYRIGW